MKRKMPFTSEQIKKIELVVEEAEKHTTGEIVPLVVFESHHYFWLHWFCGFIFLVPASLVLWMVDSQTPFVFTFPQGLLFQVMTFAAGFSLPFSDKAKRFLLPKTWAQYQVHRECLANFAASGLHETKDRTGVLIYISLLERRVQILGDSGIHQKLPDGYWDTQVKELVDGMRVGKGAEALCQVIEEIGAKLAESFPASSGKRNEHSNHLRVGPQEPPTS